MSNDDLAELSEDAFEDSGTYEFKGRPLWFGYRHYYALTAISSQASMSAEEQVLLVFWIATHSPDGIKQLRADWRKEPDHVFERFEDVPEDYGLAPGSQDMLDLALVVEKIWSDIDNSPDEVKKSKSKGGWEEPDDQPGK